MILDTITKIIITMKKNILKLMAIGVLPLFIAVSCSNDDEIEPLTNQEATEMLSAASQQMTLTIGEIMQTDAVQAIMTFDNLYGIIKESSPKLAETTQKLILLAGQPAVNPKLPSFGSASKVADDTPWGNYGTYTWDATLPNWTYKEDSDSELIFKFPFYNVAQEEKNAVLTLQNFSALETGFLTSMKLSLTVDKVELLSVDYGLALNAENFENLSLIIEMSPFFLSADMILTPNNTGLMLGLQNSMKKEGVTIQSSNIEAQFAEFALPNLFVGYGGTEPEMNIMPLTVEGYVQMGEVKATFELNIAEFMEGQQTNPANAATYADKNLKIKLYAYPAGNSLAYVKWYYNSQQGILEAFLVFSNGDEEPAINFLPEILIGLLLDPVN